MSETILTPGPLFWPELKKLKGITYREKLDLLISAYSLARNRSSL